MHLTNVTLLSSVVARVVPWTAVAYSTQICILVESLIQWLTRYLILAFCADRHSCIKASGTQLPPSPVATSKECMHLDLQLQLPQVLPLPGDLVPKQVAMLCLAPPRLCQQHALPVRLLAPRRHARGAHLRLLLLQLLVNAMTLLSQ